MKIVKITGGYLPAEQQGGTAVVAHHLAKALQLLGHTITVVTTNSNGRGTLPFCNEWVEMDGVDVYYGAKDKSILPYKSTSMSKEFHTQIYDADLVLVAGVWTWYGPKVVSAANAYKKPVYLYTHGVRSGKRMRMQSYFKKLMWWNLFEKKMFANATGIIAITEDEREELLQLGVNDNIIVIPNGVCEPTRIDKAKLVIKEYLGFSEIPFIYFLGRVEPIKRIDLLITAFAMALKEVRLDARLVIAGPNRLSYREEMESLAGGLGILDKIIFTGPVKGELKAALFQECSGFALLSVSEVLAMSALEALKYEKPVVVTDSNAFEAFIAKDAMLSTASDPSSVARIFAMMIKNDKNLLQVAKNGKSIVDSDYDWESVARLTEKLVNSG